MKKKRLLMVLIVVIVAIYLWISYSGKNSGDTEKYYGEAYGKSYHVSALTSGLIESISVKEGDLVQIGTVVATVENTDLTFQIAQAENQLNLAIAQYNKGISSVRLEELVILENTQKAILANREILENSLKSAESTKKDMMLNVNLAKATLDQKQKDYDQQKSLFEAGSIDQSTLEHSELSLKSAQKSYDSVQLQLTKVDNEVSNIKKHMEVSALELDNANQKLEIASSGYDVKSEEIAALSVTQATLNLKRLKEIGEYRKVSIKQSGIVETINFEIGEFVPTGTSLMTLYHPEELSVNIYIHEKDLPKVTLGKKISVKIANDSESESFEGTVTRIANEAMFTPLNIVTVGDRERLVYEIQVGIERLENIHPGMLLEVDLNDQVSP